MFLLPAFPDREEGKGALLWGLMLLVKCHKETVPGLSFLIGGIYNIGEDGKYSRTWKYELNSARLDSGAF